MNPMKKLAPLLLLALCLGCNGGTDGRPVAAPTSPTQPPTPPPDPPAKPTGIHVSDRGPDFVEWSWDPVDGATSYEAEVFFAGSAPDQRTRVYPEQPFYRWEGLPSSTGVRIFVRAVRETAGGRAVSSWSDIGTGLTQQAPTPLGACSNERELALHPDHAVLLVSEWDPEQPFRVWVDEDAIRMGGDSLDRPNFLEEEVLDPLRDVADRIEERLGYRVFDPSSLVLSQPAPEEPVIKVIRRDEVPLNPPWSADCAPATASAATAFVRRGEIRYNNYLFDPDIKCELFVTYRTAETAIHELAHLFGMKHARSNDDANSKVRGLVFMSEPLTQNAIYGDSDVFVLQKDIDAIGCIFPHPDHPR